MVEIDLDAMTPYRGLLPLLGCRRGTSTVRIWARRGSTCCGFPLGRLFRSPSPPAPPWCCCRLRSR